MSKRHSPCLSAFAAVLIFCGLLVGCGSTHGTIGTVRITADASSIPAGTSTQLHAIDTNYMKLTNDVTSSVSWISSDEAVATVSSSGLLSGKKAGSVVISASLGSDKGSANLQIGASVVSALTVSPSAALVYIGDMQQYSAAAIYTDATKGDATRSVVWSVTPASVAKIDGGGLLTGISGGAYTVTATSGGVTAVTAGVVSSTTIASISVAAPNTNILSGSSEQLTATALLADGSKGDITSRVVWSSSNPGLLTVNASGLAGARAGVTGDVTVTGALGSLSATTVLHVTSGAKLKSIVVEPTSDSLAAGSAAQYTATAMYTDGSQVDVTKQVTWTVDQATPVTALDSSLKGHKVGQFAVSKIVADNTEASSAVAVSSSGIYSALKPGMSHVTASFGTQTSGSTVIVTNATPMSLAIRSSRTIFPVAAIQPVQLIGTFSDGTTQDLSLTANWQSSNAKVATIDTVTGMAMGVSAGTVQFSASFGGLVVTSAVFQVLPKTLISTLISEEYSTMTLGYSEQLSVTGLYSDGSRIDVTPLATWQSQNPAALTVSSTGFLVAKGAGSSQIVATVDGIASTATLNAESLATDSISLLPAQPTLALGTTLDMTSLAQFHGAGSGDISIAAVWSSSDPSIMTVNGSGRIKAGKKGTANVVAEYLGTNSQPIAVQVTDATLKQILLSAPMSQIGTGSAQRYSAIGIFSDGNFQDISADVIWNSSDPTVASPDTTGLYRANKPGTVQVSAAFQGVNATLPLTVSNATVVSVSIVPGNSELPLGITRQYALLANFSDGTQQDVTKGSIWSTSTPDIDAVYLQGRVAGNAVGTGNVTATYGYFSASTPVRITDATLSSIALTPKNSMVRQGHRQAMLATGTFSDGYTQDLYLNAVFSTADRTVASFIAADGVANAVGIGITNLTATLGTIANTTSFRVTSNVLMSLTLAPANPMIAPGDTQQLTATGTFVDGVQYDLSHEVTWTSSDPALVAVDENGSAKASASAPIGSTATITAKDGDTTQSFTITVGSGGNASAGSGGNASGGGGGDGGNGSNGNGGNGTSTVVLSGLVVVPTSSHLAPGTGVQLEAIGTNSDGSYVDLSSSANWTSSNIAIATVNSNGVVTGVAPGLVNIQATSGSYNAKSVVNVSSATLISLAVLPNSASFAAGAAQQFTLVGTFSDDSTQTLNSLATWSSSNPVAATIDAKGQAVGIAPGTVSFTGSFHGHTATSGNIAVTPAAITALAITPSTPSFAAGTEEQFRVLAIYTDGTTHDVTSLATYNSTNASSVSVNANGLATGLSTGSAQVTASFEGQTATTESVKVTPAKLVSLTINPSAPHFAKGTEQQFTAVGTFSDGTTQDLSQQAIWTSSDPGVLTIDQIGLASAWSVGQVQVSVRILGKTATTVSVQVTPAVMNALAVSPSTATIAKGTTQQFIAHGFFTDGTSQDVSTQTIWTTSNGMVATVSSTGLASGATVGTAQISGTMGSFTAVPANLQVTAATLVSVAIDPSTPQVAAGTATQIVVRGTFSDGTTQNLTGTASFSSSNTGVATVSTGGVLAGVMPGTTVLTVHANGVTQTANVTVSNATLTSVVIHSPSSITKGTTAQLMVVGEFSDGSTQTLSSGVIFSSDNPAVAAVSNSGVVTGVAVGAAQISAAYNGVNATPVYVTITSAIPVSLSLSPSNGSLAMGGTQQYTANAVYADGSTQDVTSQATWTSSDSMVAFINGSGLATAVAAGNTNITGQVGSLSAVAALTVSSGPATLQSIQVMPSSASIALEGTQQFTVNGAYSDGSTQDLTTLATWQSSMTGVATVDSHGLASAVAAGSTQISASVNGKSSVASLVVNPATLVSLRVTPASVSLASGTMQQFHAVGKLSDGSTQDLTNSVSWSSSNTSIATMNATGWATTHSPGSVTITAQAGVVSSTSSMQVTSASVVSVSISPSSISLPGGGVANLIVSADFTDSSSQNVSVGVTYASSNTNVVTVDSNGQLHGVGAGTATVSATLGALSGTASVTVLPATLSSITVAPANVSLAAGMAQQFMAIGNYSDGSTQDITNSTAWSSSDTAVATVNTGGDVTVVQAGSVTITASSGSVSGTASFNASNAVPTAIAVTPSSVNLAAGQTQQFAATAIMSDGTQHTVTGSAHWSVSDPSVATISNSDGSNGLLSGSSYGNVNVMATLGSVSGSATVTVQSAALTSITVAPNPVSLPNGATVALTATGRYTDGSTANLNGSATFSSASASVATVDNAGMVHGTGSGNTQIVVTAQGASTTVSVTVTPATLASISITPPSPSVSAGTQLQLAAVGTYSDGNTADITSQVQWSSSSSAVATVGSTGVANARNVGSTVVGATLNGASQSVTLQVTAAVLQSITVNSPATSFALGRSLQLQAIGNYSDGSTHDLTNTVTWTSQTPSVGVVSAGGVVSGLTTGSFSAVATKGGVSHSVTITVTAAVLQSISVTPANWTILNVLGSTTQYKATGTFSDGTMQTLTTSVHWSIGSGLALGTVNQAGQFSPLGLGTGTIVATSGTITGSTGFTVVSVF